MKLIVFITFINRIKNYLQTVKHGVCSGGKPSSWISVLNLLLQDFILFVMYLFVWITSTFTSIISIKSLTIGFQILSHILEYSFDWFSWFSSKINYIYFTFSKAFIDPFKLGSLISKDFILSLERCMKPTKYLKTLFFQHNIYFMLIYYQY